MFDFLKKNEKDNKEYEEEINEDIEEDIEEDVEEELNLDSQFKIPDFDSREFFENLEYLNSYLAQLNMTLAELTKQQTIANALHILDSEYNNADSIMDVEEILQRKYALFGSIFIDYQVKQEQENNND